MILRIKLPIIILFLIAFVKYQGQDSLKLLTILTGENQNDGFGIVAGLGDVNNDGFPDFAVSAPDSEYVHLYFGGSPFDTSNYMRIHIHGDESYSLFGSSITGNGDLNNDGINDFVITNPECYGGLGALYVYFGSDSLDEIPDYTLYGIKYSSNLGMSVSIDGDINGDGYYDILAGAPWWFSYFSIYFGWDSIRFEPSMIFEEEAVDDNLGYTVKIIGDLNNDGKNEFLVNAAQIIHQDSALTYLFYGGTVRTISFENAVRFRGPYKSSQFGRWLEDLGDLNGDGFSDFVIMGRKYLKIFMGDQQNSFSDTLVFHSNQIVEGENFTNIISLGDINQDGYSDFLLCWENSSELYTGKVELYLGHPKFDFVPYITIYGTKQHGFLGRCAAYLGDINKDGKPEFAISETVHLSNPNENIEGKLYIYSYDSVTDIIENSNLPSSFKLHQNYPNPFNPATTIKYSIPTPPASSPLTKGRTEVGFVTLEIYDILGRKVATLVNKKQSPGNYTVTFNAKGLPSGIYFYKLTAGKYSKVRKMILMR